MKEHHVTVTHLFGHTTEIVFAKDELFAKKKGIAQYNKRLRFPNMDRMATGSYISNKGIGSPIQP